MRAANAKPSNAPLRGHFRLTLLFSFLITSLLIVYAEDLGNLFYGNRQAGAFLRIMAPIIP